MVPLVDCLGRVGGLEVHVAELHGHRMRGDAGAVDVAHRLRDLGADAQIAQPARSVAAAPDDVLDAIAGTYRPRTQAPGGVQHDLGALVGKHPERRRSSDRGGRWLDLAPAVTKFGQADYACRRLERQVLARIEGDFVRKPLVTGRAVFRKRHRDVHRQDDTVRPTPPCSAVFDRNESPGRGPPRCGATGRPPLRARANCSAGVMPTGSPRFRPGSVLASTIRIGAKVQADPPPRSSAVS